MFKWDGILQPLKIIYKLSKNVEMEWHTATIELVSMTNMLNYF